MSFAGKTRNETVTAGRRRPALWAATNRSRNSALTSTTDGHNRQNDDGKKRGRWRGATLHGAINGNTTTR